MDVLSQQELHQPPQQALNIPGPLVQRQVGTPAATAAAVVAAEAEAEAAAAAAAALVACNICCNMLGPLPKLLLHTFVCT